MDLSRPARAVIPTLAAEVLLVLARVVRPLTGRQVHRLISPGGASQKGVSLVLRHLVDSGLVDATPAGRAVLYQLNRDHVAADAVAALVDLRGTLFGRIRTHMASWTTPPLAAAVFGSAARGDGGIDSDIDLLVVRPSAIGDDDPAWARNVDDLSDRIRRWSGNPCSLLHVDPNQLNAMIERDEPIVASLRADAVNLLDNDVLTTGCRKVVP
jgi:predicted nucleotidyltransferase